MASVTDIANRALRHLGHGVTIGSLTERSAEARACNEFYEQCRDEVLRDFPWSFARRTATLALVTDHTDEDWYEWAYSYRYPSDALKVLRLQNGHSRIDTRALQTKTAVLGDASGRLIAADLADAVVEYTAQVTDTAMFPPDFVQALALYLAAMIAPSVTGGDEHKLGARALALYQWRVTGAQVNDLGEQAPDADDSSDFISARG